jgi:hypothetical protein
MFRTKLTLAGLAAVAAIGAQTAVAQARTSSPSVRPFITDTLAPGGSVSEYHLWFLIEHPLPAAQPPQGYRFITDTLAPGGNPAPAQSYRFITDTLAPGGGASVAAAPSPGFNWGDAGVGAGTGAGALIVLLGGALVVARRQGRLAL